MHTIRRMALGLAGLALAWSATAVQAAPPAFKARPLPAEHIYTGGWEHMVGGGVAVFDCNGDARPEIFAAGGDRPATLFLNATAPGGDLSFTLGTLPELTATTGAYPLDIDGDGHIDLAVLRAGPNILLKGGPDCSFTDATAEFGLQTDGKWTTAFSATWEPGQNLPTLAFGNYVDRDNPDGPFGACDASQIYRPEDDSYGPPLLLEPGFCTLSMMFADWFGRGRADLWLSNDRHYYVRGGYEQMFRPDENRFLGPGDGWQKRSIWGMGLAARDLNGDGRPEVMTTSMGDQLLHLSTPQGYTVAPYSQGATAHRPHTGGDGRPSTGWHAAFGDVDNDGLPDLFIAKGNVDQMPDMAMEDPNNLLMGQPDGSFSEAAAEAGIATTGRSRGAALADLNADGKLDLVVVNRRAPMELWQNTTEDSGHWLEVELTQPAPNPRAVGAKVQLRANGRTEMQERTIGGGHAGGSALPLHFGLGPATTAQLRVTWPGDPTGHWLTVPADRTLTLERPAPER